MAATDWQPVSLGDCVDFFSGGTPSKSNASYWTGDIPWVSAKDMKSFYLHDTADHLSRSGAENGTRVMPPGTILMLVRGMTLHNDLPLCVITRPMAFNQDVRALRAKDGVEQAWLAYALLGIKSHLLSVVDSASHGTGRINTPVLRDVQMLLPPPAEQRAIAAVLGALDDKIEVNRKQARVLEQIARAVFKSWFVDFDPVRRKAAGQPTGLPPDLDALFPSRLTDSPIGPVPEGWRVGTLGELLSLSRDAIHPGEHPDEEFEHFSIPAFDNGQMPSRDRGETIKGQKFVVIADCVLVSKLNPRAPRVWLPHAAGSRRQVASTEFLICTGHKAKHVSREFVYCMATSEPLVEHLTTHATGTSNSHQRVRPQDFLGFQCVQPPGDVLRAFTHAASPILKRTAASRAESATLAALRDALLPKLISGKLRIADAEKIVGRAV